MWSEPLTVHDERRRSSQEAYKEGYPAELEKYPVSAYTLASVNDHLIPDTSNLLEQLIDPNNLRSAHDRVVHNKGCAGVDGMTVFQLYNYLKSNWKQIKEQLVAGTYQPKPVRKEEIPKDDGGVRMLGIPTVVDRWLQQALHQILSPIFEPTFSPNSFGFRAGKSAHQAVLQAQKFQHEGYRWVVDMDLKQFFDEVNHDVLMSLISKRIEDKRILRLIRSFLQSGMMVGGVEMVRTKGTPQGGPLSPLLSNILLNELDRELEKRGHRFCRYADDCNIYVKTKRSGERVMKSVKHFVEKRLRLKVNEEKSAVARPWTRTFLGFTFSSHKRCKIYVPQKSIQKFRNNLKVEFRKGKGRNVQRFIKETLNPKIIGWINYFRLAEAKGYAEGLDGWIRRHLRKILWKQWKRPWRRFQNLKKYGIEEERARESAFNGRGSWFNSGASHMNDALRKKFFDNLGLESLLRRVLAVR